MRALIVPCPLGRVLIAADAVGVTALFFGEDDAALLAELGGQTQPGEELRPWADAIVRQLNDGTPAAVPLSLHGSPFQRSVWDALRQIPPGATRTYTQLAAALGMSPTAARAVARGCATNPVSLLVPCHRVLRGDGHLGGYRWGLARKQWLIDAERRQAALRPAPAAAL